MSSTMLSAISLLCILLSQVFPCIVRAKEAIDELPGFKKITLPGVEGPEGLAFDGRGGGPYTGVSDGRVLKWRGHNLGWATFAVPPGRRAEVCDGSTDTSVEDACGRPLGLQFSKATGYLYIADAYYGLLEVGPGGGVAAIVATEAKGVPFVFLNGLNVDQGTGMVYFTESSSKYQRRDYAQIVTTGDATGRLIRYNPTSKEVTVLAKDLAFANGVAVSKCHNFVLVAETSARRVLRYWLEGPMAGTLDTFAEVPGYPDNIKNNHKGGFWVALNLEAQEMKTQVAARLSEEGAVLKGLYGKNLAAVSDIEVHNRSVWIGSTILPYVGCYHKMAW